MLAYCDLPAKIWQAVKDSGLPEIYRKTLFEESFRLEIAIFCHCKILSFLLANEDLVAKNQLAKKLIKLLGSMIDELELSYILFRNHGTAEPVAFDQWKIKYVDFNVALAELGCKIREEI